MSENQEEILANFQSITAIEDVAEAIFHLEESNWDLLTAVHRVLPQETVQHQHEYSAFSSVPSEQAQQYPRNNVTVEELNDLDIVSNVDELMTAPSSPVRASVRNIYGSDMISEPSTDANIPSDIFLTDYNNGSSSSSSINCPRSSSSSSNNTNAKQINFTINYKYNKHKISISDQATIGGLKLMIMNKTGVHVSQQHLSGWNSTNQNADFSNNSQPLMQLNLKNECDLFLHDSDPSQSDNETVGNSMSAFVRLPQTFTLNILHQPGGKSISLKFPGLRTLLDIKTDVYAITDIPVRHQVWQGWPNNIQNNTTLAESGIDFEHNFVLKSSVTTPSTARSTTTNHSNSAAGDANNIIEIDSSDSSVDEFEDASDFNADDDLFTDTTVRNRVNYLIPDETDDEKVGSLQFIQNYIERYGEPHPEFYLGSLEEALNEACHKPARDRKLLAIYLHHDGSVLTNVFCDQLLKCETIMETLHHNFILYGWDLTYESNKNMFLSSISACGGITATITVRNMQMSQLPAILIIGKSRSTCEVLSVIHGNVGKDDLLNKLIDTINMYSDQRDIEVREENERAAREQVKLEQDVAYNESLEADRQKEETKRQKEYAIATERKRLESERQEIEALREANRLAAERCVPPEPEIGADGVAKIRIRGTKGNIFERRFRIDEKLDILLKFIASKGFPIEEFKVISSFPRRDLTTVNADETLQHYKLYPQETVTLEER